MSEQDLASAIMTRALEDATSVTRFAGENAAITREQARRFCTDVTGGWAKSREVWCDTAGVNPVAFRERAICIIRDYDAYRRLPAPHLSMTRSAVAGRERRKLCKEDAG